MKHSRTTRMGPWLVTIAGLGLMMGAPLVAEPGLDAPQDREPDQDRTARALERVERDAARSAERAIRDEVRFSEDRSLILSQTGDDPSRQAKLDADRAEARVKAQEEANKSAERLAEDLAKAQEDTLKDAADLAEHAAEAGEYGSSAQMSTLASTENPDYDPRGFPVRAGEIVALDVPPATMAALQDQGFTLLAQQQLEGLGATIFRLGAPEGMNSGTALDMARRTAPDTTFDFTHYYGMQYQASGMTTGPRAAGATLGRKQGELTIGMIDTGVADHTALRGVRITRQRFGTGAEAASTRHGTAVASILASEGTTSLIAADVFRGTGETPFTSADAIVDALNWMVKLHVPVVNMSLSGPRNAILDSLIKQAIGRRTLIVAAAGNGGPSAPPAYPAALPAVVAVTAVDSDHRIYRYANQGSYITVAAMGVGQSAADDRGGITRFSGTSFATPHVAAWVARCLAGKSGNMCLRSLRQSATDLGAPGFDPVYGHGLIQ